MSIVLTLLPALVLAKSAEYSFEYGLNGLGWASVVVSIVYLGVMMGAIIETVED